MYLTPDDVAKREGIDVRHIRRMLNAQRITPAMHVGGRWFITPHYIILPPARGRPPGARNRNPYPTGVRRPRRGAEPPAQE